MLLLVLRGRLAELVVPHDCAAGVGPVDPVDAAVHRQLAIAQFERGEARVLVLGVLLVVIVALLALGPEPRLEAGGREAPPPGGLPAQQPPDMGDEAARHRPRLRGRGAEVVGGLPLDPWRFAQARGVDTQPRARRTGRGPRRRSRSARAGVPPHRMYARRGRGAPAGAT